jgi:hypothetical protein
LALNRDTSTAQWNDKIIAAMNNRSSCEECQAIARELGEAYAEAWNSADQASRDAWAATYNLIGGTENDAERAEELIPRARFRDPLPVNQALRRRFVHETRSGHKVVEQ